MVYSWFFVCCVGHQHQLSGTAAQLADGMEAPSTNKPITFFVRRCHFLRSWILAAARKTEDSMFAIKLEQQRSFNAHILNTGCGGQKFPFSEA